VATTWEIFQSYRDVCGAFPVLQALNVMQLQTPESDLVRRDIQRVGLSAFPAGHCAGAVSAMAHRLCAGIYWSTVVGGIIAPFIAQDDQHDITSLHWA